MAEVVQANPSRKLILPVSGAGADVPVGTMLMPGVTQGTNVGVAIPFTATSNAQALGVLDELHSYAGVGDATTATLVNWFAPYDSTPPSHDVELFDTLALVRVDYDLAATGIAVASATSTTLTITSLEASRDSSFVYIRAGTGIGQLGFLSGTTSGSAVLISALTTNLDSTSKIQMILRFFYDTPVWKVNSATAPTKLDSTAAAGTGRGVVLGRNMIRNGMDEKLDPSAHHGLTGLNSINQLVFYNLLGIVDTAWHRIA